MTKTITSVEGFVRKLKEIVPTQNETIVYRGHSRRSFRLLPSVFRSAVLRENESNIFRDLIASQASEFVSDNSTLERLVRVQHYSLPTRLLDVTWNPLVALYFSALQTDGETAEVIVIRVDKSKIKFFDSDAVSCTANLALLTSAERQALDFTLTQTEFNVQPQVDRLIQFVRAEKPYFRPQIIPDDLRTAFLVKPKLNNSRIIAQSGAFLIFGVLGELDTTPVAGLSVERIMINKNEKKKIREELDSMAINARMMFPEIESAARYFRDGL